MFNFRASFKAQGKIVIFQIEFSKAKFYGWGGSQLSQNKVKFNILWCNVYFNLNHNIIFILPPAVLRVAKSCIYLFGISQYSYRIVLQILEL